MMRLAATSVVLLLGGSERAADHALNDLTDASPTALPRRVDMELLSDLNAAHDGLATYAQARSHGNRRAMRAAAGNTYHSTRRPNASSAWSACASALVACTR